MKPEDLIPLVRRLAVADDAAVPRMAWYDPRANELASATLALKAWLRDWDAREGDHLSRQLAEMSQRAARESVQRIIPG